MQESKPHFVGHKIRIARRARGLTQKELAEETNTDQSYISIIERGQKTGSAEFLMRLSRVLKLPIEDILDVGARRKELPDDLPRGLAELATDQDLLSSLLISDDEIKALATLKPLRPLDRSAYVQILLATRCAET